MSFDPEAWSQAIITFARTNQTWAPLIVGLLAFGESLAFVSLILPFFAMLVGIGAIIGGIGTPQFWIMLTATAVGAALGDWLSYWLGKNYHAQISRMWPLRNHPEILPRGARFFQRWGGWAVVIGRFSGPLRASIPIVAGTVRMPQSTFQLANWTSAFLWAGVLLLLGDNVGQLVTSAWKFLGRS